MSSDSEIDDLQKFEESRQNELYNKAGLGRNQFQDEDVSDEEVLGLASESSENEQGQDGYYEQDDETVKERRDRVNRELDENWGDTRDNYFGGEDDIGEDEGASEEEEEEALRLQQKELDEMAESDFVDEDDLEGWKKNADDLDLEGPQEPHIIDPSSMTADERRELIEDKFPAVTLLIAELSKCETWEKELSNNNKVSDQVREIGLSALNTYKGMIYSYFSLFSDRLQKGDMAGLSQLDEHPVNEGLLMARQVWQSYQQTKWDSSNNKSEDDSNVEHIGAAAEEIDFNNISDLSEHSEHSEQSDEGNMMDEDTDLSDASNDDEFAIAKPKALNTHNKNKRNVVGDFDEGADSIEQQARAKNKQSLRFYTSQVGKGDIKKNESYSGDVDLPYRERDFERRQRLMQEAQNRGRQQRDMLGDEEDEKVSNADNDDENDDSVYAQMKSQRNLTKNLKLERHAEAVQAARAGRINEYLAENPNVDKRAINYQIEKNKGLTRKRKKENRNARVKKRVRYEAAQKRIKGVRQVYKGAEGPYQGELTGIRKNLTHSTRFKN